MQTLAEPRSADAHRMGHITQEDPIGFAGGLNLYAYANNNPATYTDPFGLTPWCPSCANAASQAVAATVDRIYPAALFQSDVREAPGPLEMVGLAFGAAAGSGALLRGAIGRFAARTGARAVPRNLAEKLTLDEAMGGAGRRIMQGRIKDSRYPEDAWAKMEHVHRHSDGTQSVVHYWQNLETGVREGFKFK